MHKRPHRRNVTQLSSEQLLDLLPEPPEGFLGYQVQTDSHMWQSVWLLHPSYSYKEGVRTIWGYIKRNGDVYPPKAKKPDFFFVPSRPKSSNSQTELQKGENHATKKCRNIVQQLGRGMGATPGPSCMPRSSPGDPMQIPSWWMLLLHLFASILPFRSSVSQKASRT